MELLLALVVIVSTIWVYFDARQIGARKGRRESVFDMGPIGWSLSVLLLWIVAFPIYLSQREAIRKAGIVQSDLRSSSKYRRTPVNRS